jgi:actin related protein 2/3 complex, subunit 2
VLRREYGDLLVAPLEGYNVTLSLDFNSQLPKGDLNEDWPKLVHKIAMLKRNCFAAVFEKYFEYQVKQDSGTHKRAVIHYRDDETMYVDASADRVVVIFSTVFKDPDDNVIGRVFMEVRHVQQRTCHRCIDFVFHRSSKNDDVNFNKLHK